MPQMRASSLLLALALVLAALRPAAAAPVGTDCPGTGAASSCYSGCKVTTPPTTAFGGACTCTCFGDAKDPFATADATSCNVAACQTNFNTCGSLGSPSAAFTTYAALTTPAPATAPAGSVCIATTMTCTSAAVAAPALGCPAYMQGATYTSFDSVSQTVCGLTLDTDSIADKPWIATIRSCTTDNCNSPAAAAAANAPSGAVAGAATAGVAVLLAAAVAVAM